MSLASRNLLQDKLRSILSIAGVGLAIMLILTKEVKACYATLTHVGNHRKGEN